MADDEIIGLLEGLKGLSSGFLKGYQPFATADYENRLLMSREQAKEDREQATFEKRLPMEEESKIRIERAKPAINIYSSDLSTSITAPRGSKTAPNVPIPEADKLDARNRAKLEAGKPKVRQSIKGTIAGLNEVEANVDKLLNNPDLWKGTGLASYLSKVPMTEAKKIDAILRTIKSGVSLDSLSELRANSPTGGALGNVSDSEGQRLENKRATLDSELETEDFREQLRDMKRSLQGSKRRLLDGYEQDYGESLDVGGSSGIDYPTINQSQNGLPKVGDTFQGGKVLSIKRKQ